MSHLVLEVMNPYHRWAQEKLFRVARRIPNDLLMEEVGLSYASVFGTLVHLVDTQWYWRLVCETGSAPVERLSEGQFASIDSLRQHWRVEQDNLEVFTATLTPTDLEGWIEYTWPRARPRSRRLEHVLMHIFVHSIHHRAEVGRHMASIGQSPGDMDFIIYSAKHFE